MKEIGRGRRPRGVPTVLVVVVVDDCAVSLLVVVWIASSSAVLEIIVSFNLISVVGRVKT